MQPWIEDSDQLIERLEAWATPLLEQSKSVYLYTPALYQLAFQASSAYDDSRPVPYIADPQNVSGAPCMPLVPSFALCMKLRDLYGGQLKPYNNARKLPIS